MSIFLALSFVLSERKYQQKIQSENPQLGSEHGKQFVGFFFLTVQRILFSLHDILMSQRAQEIDLFGKKNI